MGNRTSFHSDLRDILAILAIWIPASQGTPCKVRLGAHTEARRKKQAREGDGVAPVAVIAGGQDLTSGI